MEQIKKTTESIMSKIRAGSDCPECGSSDVRRIFLGGFQPSCPVERTGPHVERTCKKCGHSWKSLI